MPQLLFFRYNYFPDLTSSIYERIAYTNLDADDKSKLLPTFQLGQVDNSSDSLDASIASVRECVADLPYILDLSKHYAPNAYDSPNRANDNRAQERYDRETAIKERYDHCLSSLLNPHDGFAAWREFVQQFPTAVPMLQFTNPASQARAILRQAVMLATNDNSIAIRINRSNINDILPTLYNIFAVLARPSRILIVLDCGQARAQVAAREAFIGDAITRISAMIDDRQQGQLRFVCTGGSFPQLQHSGLVERDIQERTIWNDSSTEIDLRYGDYGSMYRIISPTTFRPGDFRAAVTMPLDFLWVCWRSENANDAAGWREGAAAITQDARFMDVPDCWGRDLIVRAAGGDTQGIEQTRFWIAARINIHLKTQLDLSEEIANQADLI